LPPLARPLADRFHEKVDRRGPDECWPWLGPVNRKRGGYGFIQHANRCLAAHRVACSLARGPIPAGKLVMHTCDNPMCQNPRHLRTGTVAENRADCVQKGRHAIPPATRRFGESNPGAKLSDAQRDLIIAAYRLGANQQSLGRQFGVAQSTISRLIGRRIQAIEEEA